MYSFDFSTPPYECQQELALLPRLQVYNVLAHLGEDAFKSIIALFKQIYKLEIDPCLREIAICRQAFKAHSQYELEQHREIALECGVSESIISTITSADTVSTLSEAQNLVCLVADEVEVQSGISNETRSLLIGEFGQDVALRIISVISFYAAISRILNAVGLHTEGMTTPLKGSTSPFETQH